jgi:hypothetical protein
MSKKKPRRPLCRPPKDAINVERLALNYKWVKDDGKPGLAFSGQDTRGCPYSWYPTAPDGDFFDDRAPSSLAADRTCERFHCSNGREVKAIRRK